MTMYYPCVSRRCCPALPSLVLFLLPAALPVTGQSAGFITDADITDQLEIKNGFDPVVPFYTIDVITDLGIATLTGSVESPGESNTAVQIALEGGAVTGINKLELV